MSQVPLPKTLVLPAVSVLHHTFAVPLSFHQNSEIDSLRESSLHEATLLLQSSQVNLIGLEDDLVKAQHVLLTKSFLG